MEYTESKVVFHSPLETASRVLGADLKVSAYRHHFSACAIHIATAMTNASV